MLTNNEISEFLVKYPRQYQAYLKKHHSDTYDFIMSEFPILRDFNFATKVYWHLHELTDFPTYVCPVCGTKIYLNRNVFSVMDGYDRWMNRTGCNYECSQKNPQTQEKKCNTNEKRFGVKYTSQRKEHARNCKLARERMSEERRALVQERRKKTSNERYHKDHFSQTNEYKVKVQQKNIENFGVPYASQSEVVKQRIVATFMQNYGVRNPFMVASVRKKGNDTCMKRYHTKWYQQSEAYISGKRHKFMSNKYPGIKFDSKWEVIVYEYCKDNGIDVEYSPKVKYEYQYAGETHIYHPDFLINGKIYEVKGDNFFRINETTGKEEMFCPYRDEDWSDEKYDWMCGIYEAKHQCMISHGVIILRGKSVHNLKEVFKHGST